MSDDFLKKDEFAKYWIRLYGGEPERRWEGDIGDIGKLMKMTEQHQSFIEKLSKWKFKTKDGRELDFLDALTLLMTWMEAFRSRPAKIAMAITASAAIVAGLNSIFNLIRG